MINRYPKEPPTLADLLADPLLKNIKQRDRARFLGITERTLRRWKKTGAPRQSRLLLWAVSLHGLDTLQCESNNTAALFAGMARNLAEEVDAHRRRIDHLLRLGSFDSANAPLLDHAVVGIDHRPQRAADDRRPASPGHQPLIVKTPPARTQSL